ncbi:MAG: Ldh family oxidoreductase [Omnitrophica bacterium]|nr:Ldh family oxidoreductase [Candidatus Omnitrophota bacterium]
MKEVARISAEKLKSFVKAALLKAGVRNDVAGYVTEGLIQTSLRGVDSHGVRLLPHYLEALKGGRINPDPNYKFKKTSLSTGIFDADHAFGHAAGMEAAKRAIELANESGTGHIAVYNSSHFGAAAYYALEVAHHDMIGMCFTNTDALVKSFAGKRPFLGNNPICFAAPCENEGPFCLDMATSKLTFNKIKQLGENGMLVPAGVGTNTEGVETRNPNEITALLPIGGHKGYGLSMIVEILCSMLTGMPYGPHVPKMFEAPMSEKRCLGHYISAVRIDCFQTKENFKKRLSSFMEELRSEPALDKNVPVQVAGDPEKKCARERSGQGIPFAPAEYEAFKKIALEYGIKFLGVSELNDTDNKKDREKSSRIF